MRQRWSAPRRMGVRWRLLCILAFTASQGCQPGELNSHSSALAGYLAFAPPASAHHSITPPPQSDTLQLTIPASSLDGLDFLSLSGCAVQATIGKRDSSLGRTAKASQRLLLALEFLQLAPACMQQLQQQGKEALAIRLHTAWQEHRAQLPALIFNATLGSDEFRALWLTNPAPSDYPHSDPGSALAALRSIESEVRRWFSGDYRAQNLKFELLLAEIAGGDVGEQLAALSRQGDASSLRRYRADLKSIIGLEQQLAAVLPLRYRDWQQVREQHYAMLAGAVR